MKYHNIKTVIDGIKFDSKKEAKRYQELVIMQKAGLIRDLKCQQPYAITVNTFPICKYIVDFIYYDNNAAELIIEDVKGFKTPVYKIKKKLMKACHNIEILET